VVSGFSDGASYALFLRLANGDLFTHVGDWPGLASSSQGLPNESSTTWMSTPDVQLFLARSRLIVPAWGTS
jgi:hypothetical protein